MAVWSESPDHLRIGQGLVPAGMGPGSATAVTPWRSIRGREFRGQGRVGQVVVRRPVQAR